MGASTKTLMPFERKVTTKYFFIRSFFLIQKDIKMQQVGNIGGDADTGGEVSRQGTRIIRFWSEVFT